MRAISSGQRFQPSASREREIDEMLSEWRRKRAGGPGSPILDYPLTANDFWATYVGGSDAGAFTPVIIQRSGQWIKPDENPEWYTNPHFVVKQEPDTNGYGYGILQAPAALAGASSVVVPIRLSGSTLARLYLNSMSDTAARISDDGMYLESASEGPFRIVIADPAKVDDYQNAVVSFGGAAEGQIMFQAPSGGIPKRTGATPGMVTCKLVELDGSGDINVTTKDVDVSNMATFAACENGSRLGIASKHTGGKWWVEVEDCKDDGSEPL